MNKQPPSVNNSELGKNVQYDADYNPDRLYALPRDAKRQELNLNPGQLPFYGTDYWNHYEVSWLNQKGKPIVAIAEIHYDCHSPMMIESKSLKLYFNSLNNTQFDSIDSVQSIIERDLTHKIQAQVHVKLTELSQCSPTLLPIGFAGTNIDHLDISCECYTVNASYLSTNTDWVEETLTSNLLKSNCLVTNQPDWGSILIAYRGKQIKHAGLLKYLVSFRNHNEFHEQCIERVFVDILTHCQPEQLTVYGRYTRRGGLDINPYRSTMADIDQAPNHRLIRQ